MLDIKAAVPSLGWGYMFEVLKRMFPQYVIDAIKALYTNAVMEVMLGGTKKGEIKIERGVFQGCPLSTILFAL